MDEEQVLSENLNWLVKAVEAQRMRKQVIDYVSNAPDDKIKKLHALLLGAELSNHD